MCVLLITILNHHITIAHTTTTKLLAVPHDTQQRLSIALHLIPIAILILDRRGLKSVGRCFFHVVSNSG